MATIIKTISAVTHTATGTPLAQGAYSAGATTVIIDGFSALPSLYNIFKFANHATTYFISAITPGSGQATLTIEPALTSSVPDNTAATFGPDYASPQAWVSATTGNLSGNIQLGEMYRGADFVLGDGTLCSISGSTGITSTAFRYLRAASGHRYDPISQIGVRIIKTNDDGVTLGEERARLDGIGIIHTLASGQGTKAGVLITAATNVVESVFVKSTGSHSNTSHHGFYAQSGSGAQIRNCIAVGSGENESGLRYGYTLNADGSSALNCVAYGIRGNTSTAYGFVCTNVSITPSAIKNCIAGNCKTAGCLLGASNVSAEYCLSDDNSWFGVGGNLATMKVQDMNFCFVYPQYDNFKLKYTSLGVNTGTTSSPTVTTDFTGGSRTGLMEMGCYNGAVDSTYVAPTVVVNSIGSASRDYATIAAWETATKKNLVYENKVYIGELYDDSDFDHTTTEVTITGAVADATRYRQLRPARAEDRYDPVNDVGVFLKGTGLSVLKIAENYFRLSGVAIRQNQTTDVDMACLRVTGERCTIDSVYGILSAATAGAATKYVIEVSGRYNNIRNCIVRGGNPSNSGAYIGLYVHALENVIDNCVAYRVKPATSTGRGITVGVNDKCVIRNCVAMECGEFDFNTTSGAVLASGYVFNCISSDTSATAKLSGANCQVSIAAGSVFKNAPSNDFRNSLTSLAVNKGLKLSHIFTTDFLGATRASPWDIGAYDGYIIPPQGPAILTKDSHLETALWKLERTDGTTFFFTEHNLPILFQGQTYQPVGGVEATARRKEAALKDSNLEFLGAITADKITFDDLKAGRFAYCKVTEYLISWRFPNAAPKQTTVYYIVDVEYDGEVWVAQIAGLVHLLNDKTGKNFYRNCQNTLGDEDCRVDLVPITVFGVAVTTVDDNRRHFRASSISGSYADSWFKFGRLTWKTGNNAGLVGQVKAYTQTNRVIELELRTPFNIQVGDTFDIIPGCDRLQGTCISKFANIANFTGDPFMPGSDQTLANTPDS